MRLNRVSHKNEPHWGKEYLAIGKRIRLRRLQLDITQDLLAELIGVSKGTVCKIELGKRRFYPETLIRLAQHLETTADYLLGLTWDCQKTERIDVKPNI